MGLRRLPENLDFSDASQAILERTSKETLHDIVMTLGDCK